MRRLNRNLYVMLKFTEWPETPGFTMAFPEGNKKLAGDFCANLDETHKLEMVCLISRILLQKVSSYSSSYSSAPKCVQLHGWSLKFI